MIIVNPERNDGFGAQYQSIIFCILFSEMEKLKFAYRPFEKMEHNYDSEPFFIEKKEELINLKGNFINYNQIQNSEIVNFDLSYIYKSVENNLDLCLSSMSFNDIKKSFYKNKIIPKKSNGKIVSIHIRRPNIYDIGTYGYSDDEYYLNAIREVRKKYSDIEKIKIYSQGSLNDFKKYIDSDLEFHLNESIENTFVDLVFSDVLILSKSSFSYCAGLLTDGDVYYLPFWHKPKNSWLKF
jgi:hypothetical protein